MGERMEIGSVWHGWTIESVLGKGSFGTVYKITKNELGYEYKSALKLITIPENDSEPDSLKAQGMDDNSIKHYYKGMVEELVSELAMMAKFKGTSNIVSYEDHIIEEKADSIGWNIFIRMELLTPLYDYIKTKKILVRDIVKLGVDICSALELCRKYNIIHRDIKPENIFVSNFGDFKLGDFGIARQLEKTNSDLSKKGTFTYMAPEVYKGQSYDFRADIYSLGIVLYSMMNNSRAPFLPEYPKPIKYSDKQKANLLRLSGEPLPDPAQANGRLKDIILKSCAYNPDERYDSVTQLKKDLQSVLDEEFSSVNQNPAQSSYSDTTEENTRPLAEDEAYYYPETNLMSEPYGSESKNKKPVIISVVALLAAAAIALSLFFVFVLSDSNKVIMPYVVGLKENDAVNTLIDSDLKYSIKYETSTDIGKGIVITQSEKNGAELEKQSTINLVVSKGDKKNKKDNKIKIPDVVGKSLSQAKSILDKEKLILEIGSREYSSKYKKDTVISQTAKAGSKADKGDSVSVVVSKGEKKTNKSKSSSAKSIDTPSKTISSKKTSSTKKTSEVSSDTDSSSEADDQDSEGEVNIEVQDLESNDTDSELE
jgi:serine/threonine protein kinase